MSMTHTPFRQAAAFFPPRLRRLLLEAEESLQEGAEEIRLRAGKGMSVLESTGQERLLTGQVSKQELYGVVEIATCASFHRAMERLRRGYLPLPGGHRLGVAGSVVTREAHIHHIQELSSLSLRIARPLAGVAEPVAQRLVELGFTRDGGCLILAPPGHGKTTLLRDLIRIYSDDWHLRVGIADERGEIAALRDGIPRFPVGSTVDVVEGCGKAEAGLLLLRSMNPQVIAMDEITDPEDVSALLTIAHCGTGVLATVHGTGLEELSLRPLCRPLLEQRCFQAVVTIRRTGRDRTYTVEPVPCSG